MPLSYFVQGGQGPQIGGLIYSSSIVLAQRPKLEKASFHYVPRKHWVPRDVFLVSMDVATLYMNIPQEEGTALVCKTCEKFHDQNPSVGTLFVKEMLSLLFKENSFSFNEKHYLRNSNGHELKAAVAFCRYFSWQK